MNTKPTATKIAYRDWCKGQGITFYVAQLPGDDGVDWGYTEKPSQAKPLTPYWQRKFAADCRRVGYEAHFIGVA